MQPGSATPGKHNRKAGTPLGGWGRPLLAEACELFVCLGLFLALLENTSLQVLEQLDGLSKPTRSATDRGKGSLDTAHGIMDTLPTMRRAQA